MKRGWRWGRGIALLLGPGVLYGPAPSLAFPDGAPPAHTGGFGEPTCGACHFGGEPASNAALALHGIDGTYEAGRTYEVELHLTGAEKAVGGFQMSIRFADGPGRGKPAGRLEAVEWNQQIHSGNGIDYLTHSTLGRREGGESVIRWLIRWTAPVQAGGRIAIHAAAVAGDDDESPIGDTVHTLERLLQPD